MFDSVSVAPTAPAVNDWSLDPWWVEPEQVQWYWGADLETGIARYFWVGPEVNDVTDMPNYISDEAPWSRFYDRPGAF